MGRIAFSIDICGYEFEGPFDDVADLKHDPGVYVILDNLPGSSSYSALDVGESHDLRDRVENHDRKDCWRAHAKGQVVVAARYMPFSSADDRRSIERHIRQELNPPCGEV